jgi:hypothetical protein
MTTYVPPHLRNRTKNEKKEPTTEVRIKNEEFPELVSSSKKNDITTNLKKSFAEVTFKEEKHEVDNNLVEIKAGWSIIKKDTLSNIVILDSKETIQTKERLRLNEKLKENNKYFKNLKNMIENWNNFRDTENELRGDLSPYYNYKEELEKMKEENLYYELQADEFYHNQNDSDSDDDESNRYQY